MARGEAERRPKYTISRATPIVLVCKAMRFQSLTSQIGRRGCVILGSQSARKHKRLLMADFSQEQALPLRNIHPCLVTSPQPCFSTPSSQSWSPPPPACGTPTLKQTTPRKTRTTTGVAYGPDRPNPSTSPPDSNCHPLTIREGSSSNPNCNARPLHRSWLRNRRFRFRRFGGTVGLCLSLSLCIYRCFWEKVII